MTTMDANNALLYFTKAMAAQGFACRAEGIFTKELTSGWGAWIAFTDDRNGGDLLFGPSNSSFYKLLDFCLEPIRFKGLKTTTTYTDTSIYLASPGCIEGHRKLAFQPPVKPELVAQHWGEATRTYVLDWLTASMIYDVCLLRLETYNYPMQIYRYHKAILLRLLERQQDLKAFASEWEQSLATGSALIRQNSLTFIDRVTHADLHGLIAPAG